MKTANIQKLAYVTISAVLITVFIFMLNIFPIFNLDGGDNDRVKYIYYVDNISQAHQKVIDLFNAKYKGVIKVVAINLPFEKFSTNERKELLVRYLRSKSDRIDVFAVDQIWVPRFAKWAIPLDKYFVGAERKSILPYAIETAVWNDTLMAIPLYIDVAVMYGRVDKLKSLGSYDEVLAKLKDFISWEELIKLKQKTGQDDSPFYMYQAADYEGLMCSYVEIMESLGKKLIENKKLQLQTPEAEQALQLLVDLIYKYKLSPPEVADFKENASYDFYAAKKGYFVRAWSSFQNDANPLFKIDTSLKKKIVRFPIPHFEGKKKTAVFGGWNLMVSKYSTKVPEVLKFIHFLLSEEAQKLMFESGGYVPVTSNIYNDSLYVTKNTDLAFFQDILKTGVHRPFDENYTNISDIMSYYLNAAISNKKSVKDALREAEEKINQLSEMK